MCPKTLWLDLCISRSRDGLSKRKQLCTPRVENVHLSIVWAKAARQPEQATISALVDTTHMSRERDPSSPAESVEGRELRQTKIRHSSLPLHVSVYASVLELNGKALLGCDMLSSILHRADEEGLEDCLERIKRKYQNLTTGTDEMQNYTSANRFPPNRSRRTWPGDL